MHSVNTFIVGSADFRELIEREMEVGSFCTEVQTREGHNIYVQGKNYEHLVSVPSCQALSGNGNVDE